MTDEQQPSLISASIGISQDWESATLPDRPTERFVVMAIDNPAFPNYVAVSYPQLKAMYTQIGALLLKYQERYL